MHLHNSAMQALVIFAMILPAAVAWRIVSAWKADSPVGQAMAFIY